MHIDSYVTHLDFLSNVLLVVMYSGKCGRAYEHRRSGA